MPVSAGRVTSSSVISAPTCGSGLLFTPCDKSRSTLIFCYFLRYFSSTHRTDLSRFRGTFHSFDPTTSARAPPLTLHPVQEAFIAHDGLQCGFCTPGQIMSAIGLIQEGQAGDDPERVREAMSGNLCRCGAYKGITEAVLEAQQNLTATNQRRSA